MTQHDTSEGRNMQALSGAALVDDYLRRAREGSHSYAVVPLEALKIACADLDAAREQHNEMLADRNLAQLHVETLKAEVETYKQGCRDWEHQHAKARERIAELEQPVKVKTVDLEAAAQRILDWFQEPGQEHRDVFCPEAVAFIADEIRGMILKALRR